MLIIPLTADEDTDEPIQNITLEMLLNHEKGKELARAYAIPSDVVYDNYQELYTELDANDGRIDLNTSNPQTPITIYATYIEKVVCALIVQYEFTQQELFELPGPGFAPLLLRRPREQEYHERQIVGLTKLLKSLQEKKHAFYEKLLNS